MKLVVWLGNPWQQYRWTRHNIWATMLERFLDWNKLWELKYDNKWKAETLVTTVSWEKVMFCFPQTYMNASGESVWPIAQFYKIPVEDILIIHDEIDFEPARIAFKKWWSAAGHNGLKSIISHLWTTDFNRIRIWVWRPAVSSMVADYVLSTFKPDEKQKLQDKEEEIFGFISDFLNK